MDGPPWHASIRAGRERWTRLMSLRFRLIGLICLILLATFAVGGVIAGVTASRSVRIEMRAALRVGRQTVANAVERLRSAADPSRGLNDLIASFEGNRHLRVRLTGEAESVAKPSRESSPFGRAPFWFTEIVGVAPLTARVPITLGGRDYATVTIETDAHNELQEAWTAFVASLAAQAVFYVLTISLIYILVGRTLRPLGDLAAALERVGDGRYRTRISGTLAPELARLRDSFNRMTARLASGDAENRRLNEQLLMLQEQERCDLARDLHDEVSPYLFAINADAATTSRLLKEGLTSEAHRSLNAIIDAVVHMQRQVRMMLGRLRPIGLDDFGLPELIENIVAFWRRRCPEICYRIAVCSECEGVAEPARATICRVVQECLSNAVRHAAPGLISVTVDRARDDRDGADRFRVEVADDGCGMAQQNRVGYGLLGISERVKAVGGELTFFNRSAGGFVVTAVIPCEPARDAASMVARGAEP
jgi:two-component system, NarL family, sensor histidine kinase UhpB